MTPLPAARVLDQFFLDTRCRILDVAASLDRLDRGGPSADPRVEQLRRAIQTLLEPGPGRAERVQQLFSLPYDPDWKRPQPRD
jgi:hypothetical protein